MSSSDPISTDSFQIESLRQIADACERFNASWRHEPRPPLEAYLNKVSKADRPQLLLELIALELELRREQGEKPVLAEYLARFPHDAENVAAAFAGKSRLGGASRSNSSTPPPAGSILRRRSASFKRTIRSRATRSWRRSALAGWELSIAPNRSKPRRVKSR